MRFWLGCYDRAFGAWQELVVFPAVVVFARAAGPVLGRVLAMAGDDEPADAG